MPDKSRFKSLQKKAHTLKSLVHETHEAHELYDITCEIEDIVYENNYFQFSQGAFWFHQKKAHVLFGKIKNHNICHTGTGGRAGTPSLTINKIKNKKNTHKTHLKKRCGGVRRQKNSLIILSFRLVSQKSFRPQRGKAHLPQTSQVGMN